MNVVAVRDDGALLVTTGGQVAAIVSDEGAWLTTRGAALARGTWTEPGPGDTVPSAQYDAIQVRLTAALSSEDGDETSLVATFDASQPRDPLGMWTADGGSDDTTEDDFSKMSEDAQIDLLIATMNAADAGEPGAQRALDRLHKWIESDGKGGGGGGGSGGGGKSLREKAAEKVKQATEKAEKDRERETQDGLRPEVANKKHPDGYVAGESSTGKSRIRYDAEKEDYVVEQRSDVKSTEWHESRRLSAKELFDELSEHPERWERPSDVTRSPARFEDPHERAPAKKAAPAEQDADEDEVNRRRRMIEDVPTVSASEPHSGAMVALVPSDEDGVWLAVDGGEDPDDLHVTLCFLGEAALVPAEVRERLVECVARCVESSPTVIGRVFSVALFNPTPSGAPGDSDETAALGGHEPCVVLLTGGSQLERMHLLVAEDVRSTLASAGVEYPSQHTPWVPHITLLYGDADPREYANRTGFVTFDRVRVAFGDDVYDIPLGDSDAYDISLGDSDGVYDAVSSGFDPSQQRDIEGKWTDESGGGSLGDLWENFGDHVGQVIAETLKNEFGVKQRAVVREKNGKPYVEVQSQTNDGPWKKWTDIRKQSDFNEQIAENEWAGWKSVSPHEPDESGEQTSIGKQYTPINPPGSDNYGTPRDEWVNVSADDTPADWSTGSNVITADEAREMHDTVMSQKSWDEDTATTIYDYTQSAQPINEALRNRSSVTFEGVEVRETTRYLDKAMYPAPRDLTVFRQVNPSAFGATNVAELVDVDGKMFKDLAYLSTSVTQDSHLDFISDVHMRLDVPKGTKVAYVADVSQFPEQNELLLRRGAKIRINRVEVKNGRAFIYAEVVK